MIKHPAHLVVTGVLKTMISQAETAIARNRQRLAQAEIRPPLAKQLRVSIRLMKLRLADLRRELDAHQEAFLRAAFAAPEPCRSCPSPISATEPSIR